MSLAFQLNITVSYYSQFESPVKHWILYLAGDDRRVENPFGGSRKC